MQFRRVLLHASDADLRDLPDVHPQHLAAFQDQRPVAFCGEFLVLPLLHEAFQFHVLDPVGTHPRGSLNDAAEFINREQRFFQIRFRRHIGADRIPMAQDGPDISFRNAGIPQRFLRVLQMFVRILLVIIIVQIAHGFPVFPVSAKVLRHGSHAGGYIRCVQQQMYLRNSLRIDPSCLFDGQLFHPFSSFFSLHLSPGTFSFRSFPYKS